MKINAILFCILLIYSYLCTRFSENPMHSTTRFVVIKALSVGRMLWQQLINHQITIMYLDHAKKEEIFNEFGKGNTDTGSAESQIALFTYRIKHLTEHLKQNHKDFVTARSLTKMVGRRRKLLKYLYVNDINRYRAIVKALGLRK